MLGFSGLNRRGLHLRGGWVFVGIVFDGFLIVSVGRRCGIVRRWLFCLNSRDLWTGCFEILAVNDCLYLSVFGWLISSIAIFDSISLVDRRLGAREDFGVNRSSLSLERKKPD